MLDELLLVLVVLVARDEQVEVDHEEELDLERIDLYSDRREGTPRASDRDEELTQQGILIQIYCTSPVSAPYRTTLSAVGQTAFEVCLSTGT